jgi:hypothetical protein
MSKKKERGLLEEISEFFFPSDPEPRNINEWLLGKTIPCFFCKRALDIRFTKKDRPYTICNECQIQLFIRGGEGFRRLVALVKKQEDED